MAWYQPSEVLRRRQIKRLFFILIGVSGFYVCYMILRTSNLNQTSIFDAHLDAPQLYNHSTEVQGLADNLRLPSHKESQVLFHKVKVLCWVLTRPATHESRALHVKRTWGRRCNKLLFMSSKEHPGLESINLNVSEGRDHLWNKTYTAFKYIYEHHMEDADWFIKTDDDTYVILENLRAFLAGKNSSDPVFYGYFFNSWHVSGGAGYVLSKRAVEMFVKGGVDKGACPNDFKHEDVAISACLKEIGVRPGDSKDSQGRERFHPFIPAESLLESYEYADMVPHSPGATEKMRCSDSSITFHYIQPGQMYALEYFIYHFNLQGGAYPEQSPVAYYLNR